MDHKWSSRSRSVGATSVINILVKIRNFTPKLANQSIDVAAVRNFEYTMQFCINVICCSSVNVSMPAVLIQYSGFERCSRCLRPCSYTSRHVINYPWQRCGGACRNYSSVFDEWIHCKMLTAGSSLRISRIAININFFICPCHPQKKQGQTNQIILVGSIIALIIVAVEL